MFFGRWKLQGSTEPKLVQRPNDGLRITSKGGAGHFKPMHLTHTNSYAITHCMKLHRSTKCSFKFATEAKRTQLQGILKEYGVVVNFFIGHFWNFDKPPTKGELLKTIVDLPASQTWLSARLRKVAAREALSLISSVRKRWKDKATKPYHKGNSMYVSSTIVEFRPPKDASEFDAWLRIWSVGAGIILDFPLRFHKHYHKLTARGRRLNSYIIRKDSIQIVFEIETAPKRTEGIPIGIDTGINALASLDNGKQFGTDIKPIIERIKRCQHGSKGQQKARRNLKQRMDEVARDVVGQSDTCLVVVERLKELNHKTKVKRRLTRNMRRSLGIWVYRYWLNRIQSRCEDNRVVFRSVNPAYTSQRCRVCGHTERRNRSGDKFLCQSCGHIDNADVNAAGNILDRFLWGPYGAPFKPLVHENRSRGGTVEDQISMRCGPL